jgi:hypothetical protein
MVAPSALWICICNLELKGRAKPILPRSLKNEKLALKGGLFYLRKVEACFLTEVEIKKAETAGLRAFHLDYGALSGRANEVKPILDQKESKVFTTLTKSALALYFSK